MKLVLLWSALLAVAIGLPLLALAADRADARRVPTGPGDLWAFCKEHGLSTVDAELVGRALEGGHSLEDPRLRRLVALRVAQVLPRAERHQRLELVEAVLPPVPADGLLLETVVQGFEARPSAVVNSIDHSHVGKLVVSL